MREAKHIISNKLMCKGRVWNINHGRLLVHHSFAASPAARWILNQHLPGYDCKIVYKERN